MPPAKPESTSPVFEAARVRRIVRQTLLILLTIPLSVFGWTSVALPAPCAMQAVHMDMTMDDGTCCPHDHADHGKGSRLCKAGGECSGSVVWQLAAIQQSPVIPVSAPFLSFSAPLFAKAFPAAVWRPPQH
jgi:hypothetical protein